MACRCLICNRSLVLLPSEKGGQGNTWIAFSWLVCVSVLPLWDSSESPGGFVEAQAAESISDLVDLAWVCVSH